LHGSFVSATGSLKLFKWVYWKMFYTSIYTLGSLLHRWSLLLCFHTKTLSCYHTTILACFHTTMMRVAIDDNPATRWPRVHQLDTKEAAEMISCFQAGKLGGKSSSSIKLYKLFRSYSILSASSFARSVIVRRCPRKICIPIIILVRVQFVGCSKCVGERV
jgi:hypothetical protein